MIRFLSISLILLSSAVFANQPVGVVLSTQGSVVIEREGSTLMAQRRTDLFENDTVQTATGAGAEIKFNDDTVTSLGGDTRFVIQKFEYQADDSSPSNHAVTELIAGSLRTVTGHLLDKPGSDFIVQTPEGVLGVRGTEFWCGYLDNADDIDVLLIEGEHALEVRNKEGAVLLNKAGEGTKLSKNAKQKPVVKVWPKEKVEKALKKVKAPTKLKKQKVDPSVKNSKTNSNKTSNNAKNNASNNVSDDEEDLSNNKRENKNKSNNGKGAGTKGNSGK